MAELDEYIKRPYKRAFITEHLNAIQDAEAEHHHSHNEEED